ncbi:MAG: hypothetical protein KA144_07065 [Xanthomonadaceae bacterium]|nr:hypothetical protein [Xanthomonadaceae bacterium]
MHALSVTAIRSARNAFILRTATVAMLGLALVGCTNESARSPADISIGKIDDTATTIGLGATRIRAAATAVNVGALQNPVLFVTQVPTPGADPFAGRMSTFANHLASVSSVPRGGDLMIRYPDGSVRNLTREAGYGMQGLQTAQAIAVREPTVHWDGKKAVFSMVVGAPPQQYAVTEHRWQLYEVTGLEQGGTAVVTKVPHQPAQYNNVSPFYASDDRILFASDRPIGGAAHLYPQLDEYESTATITGLYSLDPASGALKMLNHTPSGAFSPSIDSYGRIVFVRWDHLQRDQQADAGTYGAFNFASEAPDAARLTHHDETFPEPRQASSGAYGAVAGYTSNLFTPWQMQQDGSGELTLNHIGRQEMAFGYLPKSFLDDAALSDYSNEALIANRKRIRQDGGVFHVREDPRNPGMYYAIHTGEFGTMTSNQIVRFTGAPQLNPEQMTFENASAAETGAGLPGGRFRNPLPMSGGQMVASYTPNAVTQTGTIFRLHQLLTDPNGLLVAGPALTPGIQKTLSWWSPDALLNYSGPLWEIEATEVAVRRRPDVHTPPLPAPEKAVIAEENIDEALLREWLKANDLALIVTRDQTSRDRGDRQQPFNLRVPAGTVTTNGNGRVYDIAHYQILQANAVRGYGANRSGRRPIAQPMTHTRNPPNASGPPGSVKIAADGSTAAFVPANRALTWQTTDANGVAIVRERLWVTMQPGEIRTCTGCHGQNAMNQAGEPEPANKPEALRALLRHWKQTANIVIGRGSAARPRPPHTASSTVKPMSASAAAIPARAQSDARGDGSSSDRGGERPRPSRTAAPRR